MIKVKATCKVDFCGDYAEKEFEFEDDYPNVNEIWRWAEQFLNVDWEIIKEDKEDDNF